MTQAAPTAFATRRGLDRKQSLVAGMTIPPRPDVLVKLQEELRRGNPDLAKMARLIGSDVSLSAAVLQIVNSPMFRLPRTVSSISQAAMLLGLGKLMSVVRAVSLKSKLAPALKLARFWDTAEDVARTCALLATKVPVADVDELYTLGLFHDCGIPIMMLHYKEYKDILRQVNDLGEQGIAELESEFYGVNHAEVGYWLGRSWFLPECLCEVIALHHEDFARVEADDTIDIRVRTLLALLTIARNVSAKYRTLWRTQDPGWGKPSPSMLAYLGLSEKEYNDLEQQGIEHLDSTA